MNLSFSSHGKYISARSLYKYPQPALKSSLDRSPVLNSSKPTNDPHYKKQESLKLKIKPKPNLTPSSQSRTFLNNLLLPSTPPSSQFPSFRFFNRQITSNSIWSINHNSIRHSYLSSNSPKSSKSSKSSKLPKPSKPLSPAKPNDPLDQLTSSSPLSPQIPRVEIKYKLKKLPNFPKS